MNKTLLLIICDFLLISILALVEIDAPEPPPAPEVVTNEEAAEGMQDDLVELLALSLEEAAAEQAELQDDLARRAEELAAREQALAQTTETLTQTEEERAALERARRELEAERARLAQTVTATQEELTQTAEERAAAEAALAEQRRQAQLLQETLQAREAALAEAETRASELAEARDELESVRRRLETDLEIRETEKAMLSEQIRQAETRVEIARVEREQAERRAEALARNVGELAEQSEALAERSEAIQEEIRAATPQSLNQIYATYEANRLTLSFTGQSSGAFGSRSFDESTPTLLVRHNGQVHALFAVENTPLRERDRSRLRRVTARLALGNGQTAQVTEVNFLAADPRIASFRVPTELVTATGKETFFLAEDPLRFESVVILARELGAYGELPTRLEPGGQSLRVQREFFGEIFGDFAPRRGDFVFARTGELIGLLVDSDRAVILEDLGVESRLRLP